MGVQGNYSIKLDVMEGQLNPASDPVEKSGEQNSNELTMSAGMCMFICLVCGRVSMFVYMRGACGCVCACACACEFSRVCESLCVCVFGREKERERERERERESVCVRVLVSVHACVCSFDCAFACI